MNSQGCEASGALAAGAQNGGMPPAWSWPPPGYDPDVGYVDDVDVVYAEIVNSIKEKIDTLVTGTGSAYADYVASGGTLPLVDWLASLQGADGTPGAAGAPGTNGLNGTDGKGVVVVDASSNPITAVPAGTPDRAIVLMRTT